MENIKQTLEQLNVNEVVIYARTARDEEGQLMKQVNRNIKLAERLGVIYSIIGEVSGANDFTRTALTQIREEVKKGEIKAIMVEGWDRFTRNALDLQDLLVEFENNNVVLIDSRREVILDYSITHRSSTVKALTELFMKKTTGLLS